MDRSVTRALLMTAGLCFAMFGAIQSVFGPALPYYVRVFDLSDRAAAMFVSAYWIGSFSAVILMYFHAARLSPRLGILGMALGAGLLASQANWPVVVAGAAIIGTGAGVVAAGFNPRILHQFGPRGPSMLSLLNALFSLGAIVAPGLYLAAGSQPSMIFAGLAVCAILALVTGGRAARASAGQTERAKGFRPHLPILLFGMAAVGIEASLIGLGPSALIRAGLPEPQAAGLMSLFFVAFLTSRTVLIFVADRVPSFGIYVGATGLTAAAGFACAVVDLGPIFPTLIFPVLGLASGLYFPSYYISASRLMGADPRVAPLALAFALIGGIVVPQISGLVTPMLGPRGFFWLLAGYSLALTLLAAAMARPMARGPR